MCIRDSNGPIGIVKAVLNQNGKEKNVYIVALSGTELIWSDYTGLQSTGAVTDLLCGFNLDNPYIKAVVKAMKPVSYTHLSPMINGRKYSYIGGRTSLPASLIHSRGTERISFAILATFSCP